MKKTLLTISMFPLLVIGAWGTPALAHQPRIVDSEVIVVSDPEISKAYYGSLSGSPHIYTVIAAEPFNLYVGILMPYDESSKKDVVAEIYKEEEFIKVLGGESVTWERMFEFFGQSAYLDGGDYEEYVGAGVYTIVVSSKDNTSKYSLAIGTIEAFDGDEIVNALTLIPELKQNFFNESPISFIKSPFGWGYILIMYIVAFAFGFLYRALLKNFAKGTVRDVQKNIGRYDRAVRFAIWAVLLGWAITTSWNPLLLFFSGFALFEALFSWCGLYATLGKNSCPS